MVMGPGFGIGFGFQMFQIIFFVVFALAISTVLISLIKGAKEWNKNNHSPRLTVPATVVTKRTDVTRRRSGGTNAWSSYCKWYAWDSPHACKIIKRLILQI